ncbi:MAG: choice-of-anchor D domain-containing protein, partial [Chthoniobacteraceae bacterium]
ADVRVPSDLLTNVVAPLSPSDGERVADRPGEGSVGLVNCFYRFANPTAHTPEPVNVGNFHLGDPAPSQALSIMNNVPNDGFSETLNASIGSPTGGVTVSGAFTALAPGATNNTSLLVGFNTATVGTKNGTATITLVSNGTGNSGLGLTTLPSQTLNLTGAVYRLAQAGAHTPEPVVFTNRHVGDLAQQAITIGNTAANDSFSERLDGTVGAPVGDATAAGSFSLLAPGAMNSTSLLVGIDTSSAGAKSGSVPIALTSDGAGTSGLGLTPLAAQTVNVSGNVFRLAQPAQPAGSAVNLGIIHVGETAQANVIVMNAAANDGYSEALNASFSAASGAANGSGAFSQLAPGDSSSVLAVSIEGSTAGNKTGSAFFNMVSDGTGTSGLGTTNLGSVEFMVSAQVNNFAQPIYLFDSGAATLTGSGNAFTLDFGTVQLGAAMPQAQLSLNNGAAGPADSLAGTFLANAPAFTLAGFVPFSGVAAGQSLAPLSIGLGTGQIGSFDESIALNPRSQNASGFDGALAPVTLTLRGQVVPEPSSLAFLVLAAPLLALRRRRAISACQNGASNCR